MGSSTLDISTLRDTLFALPLMDDEISTKFENTFRECIASADFTILASGHIPQQTIFSSLQTSLKAASELAQFKFELTQDTRYSNLQHQIWNPLVEQLVKLVSLKPDTRTTCDVSSPPVKPRIKPTPAPVSLPEKDIALIRAKLKATTMSKRHLFATPGHAHIKCSTENCAFCSHLFHTVNITKCTGHKRCNSIGYYPHVGVSLWRILKKKHDSGQSPRIRIACCKEYELPALGNESEDCMDTQSNDGTVIECAASPLADQESIPASPLSDTTSQYSYQSRHTPCASPKRKIDWANESVESYYHQVRATKKNAPSASSHDSLN